MKAETVAYINGPVLTMDRTQPTARVLVTRGDTILHLGEELPSAIQPQRVVDLAGRTIIPLLADSHIHFTSYATFLAGLYVYDAYDLESLLDLIRGYLSQHDGVILGFGASAWALREERLPTRQELDRVTGSRPLFLVKYDGHGALVNSAMLEQLPDEVLRQRGVHREEGVLELEAFYQGVMAITANVSLLSLLKTIGQAAHHMVQQGFGMMHAVEGVGFKKDLDVIGLLRLGPALPLETRLFFQTLDVKRVQSLKLRRVGGCFACALDGCFGSKDAALHEPYADDPHNRGVLFYDQETVDRFVDSAHQAGLQIAMHAIGDRAVTQAIDAFAKALQKSPRLHHHHTIIHASLITERDKDRLAELGLCVTNQPAILTLRQEPPMYLERIIGDRAHQVVPIGSLARRGIPVTFGSDAPVTLPSLATSLHAAVNHPVPGEEVDVLTALTMHTRASYEMTGDEQQLGSLVPGKRASFVILTADPRALPPEQLTSLSVDSVIRQGRPYPASWGGLPALAKDLVRGYLQRRHV